MVIAAIGAIAFGAWRPAPPFIGALAAVALVAAVGWRDDRHSLSARTRLAVHLLAGLLVAWYAKAAPGPWGVVGVTAIAWWAFWSVAAINVTNFMDGIDGMIGLQMVVFGVHAALLANGALQASVVGAALAGACLGFLPWNWAPARIFLGDVGSGALGLLAVLSGLTLIQASAMSVELAFLPLFPLFLDATLTLARRVMRGERIWEAHREHLYQRLARGGWGHARVTLLFAALAMLGAAPARLPVASQAGGAAAYLGVVMLTLAILEGRRQAPHP